MQFRDVAVIVIPTLQQRAPARPRKLRILSAGCSNGEEPYALAMTFLEAIGRADDCGIEIVAVDLSEECIAFASAGRYPEERLEGVPRGYLEKYFNREGDDWVVRDEVKGLVRFVKADLIRAVGGEGIPGVEEGIRVFDLIFCRDVLISLPIETQQLLIEGLQGLLTPGGYLCTGDAEPLYLYRHDLQTVCEACTLTYRKRDEESPNCEPAPAPGDDLELPAPVWDFGVKELLICVADSALWLRDEAIARLLQRDLDAIAPALEEAVRNNFQADLRNGAMEILVRFGEEAVPMLTAFLHDADEEVRSFATVMLGRIASRSAVDPLIAALQDPDPNVRHGSAEALGRIGDERAVAALLELLDQGFWLQFAAVAALGSIGSPAAVPCLLKLLDDELLFAPVAQALQEIGDPRALPALRAVAEATDPMRGGLASRSVAAIEQKTFTTYPVLQAAQEVAA